LILLNIKKKTYKSIVLKDLIYYVAKRIIIFLLLNLSYNILKQLVVIKNLGYLYNFKWISYSPFVLKNKLSCLFEFFNFLNKPYIQTILTHSLIKSRHFFSVIRSPFVYKKSMEQLFYWTYKLCHYTNIFRYDIFLQEYQSEILKKELSRKMIVKFSCKIIYYY